MQRKLILLAALSLDGRHSIILSRQHSRSPQLGHLTNICKQCCFHHFINICQSPNVKLNEVHNVRKLWIQFEQVDAEQSSRAPSNVLQVLHRVP